MRYKLGLLLLLCVSGCCIAGSPEVSSVTYKAPPNIRKVAIQAIDFYSDREFTELAPDHWYMPKSRQEVRTLVRQILPRYNFEFLESSQDPEVLYLRLDLYIFGGLGGVASYIRAHIIYKGEELFVVKGSGACPSLQLEEIRKAQRQIAEMFVKEFAEKMSASTK